MSFATELNTQAISLAAVKFPITMSQWTINKVWLCETTNAIRIRFKNESIGMIGGVVKPSFSVRTSVTFSEILENVTLDRIVFANSFIDLCEAFSWTIE